MKPLLLAAALAAIPIPGIAGDRDKCVTIAAIARIVEEQHQAGEPLAAVLDRIGDDMPAFQAIAERAYSRPVLYSEELARLSAAEFASEIFAQCQAAARRLTAGR